MVKNKIKDIDVPGWSRSLETAYKEEGGCFIEAEPIAVGSGAV